VEWWANHQSYRLWEAWNAPWPDGSSRCQMREQVPVPGRLRLPLRSRFLLYIDERFIPPPAQPALRWGEWCDLLRCEAEVEALVNANRADAAAEPLRRLAATEMGWPARLATVHAEQARGDLARQADRPEEAMDHYRTAVAVAEEDGYVFGRVRAELALGYLLLAHRTAGEAAAVFGRVRETAAAVGDRLYEANALIGRGEARSRLASASAGAHHEEAEEDLCEALTLMRELRSDMGVGNAALRLAVALQHIGDRSDEVVALLEEASDAFSRAGNPIGQINALDTLADQLFEEGQLDEAARRYDEARAMAVDARDHRNVAHTTLGMARCAVRAGATESARALLARAAAAYEAVADLRGVASVHEWTARADQVDGDLAGASRELVDAVHAVEQVRGAHDRDQGQQELVARFASTYRAALRAAVAADDEAAFVVVAESLAGRRLAGLVGQEVHADGAVLLGALVARADQRKPSGHAVVKVGSRRERIVRGLGALSLSAGLRQPAAEQLADLLAAIYRPVTIEEVPELLARPRGTRLLVLVPVPGTDEVAWYHQRVGRPPELGLVTLTGPSLEVIDRLGTRGPGGLVTGDLAALSEVVPTTFADEPGAPTTVVTVGSLWGVPWAAVPVADDALMGEVAPLSVCPSLSLLRHASSGTTDVPSRVVTWRHPDIRAHELAGFVGDRRVDWRQAESAGQVRTALTGRHEDLVVVACHGRTEGAYLELAPDEPLPLADLLVPETPAGLVLASCWGASRTAAPTSDPLTFATVALARTTEQVVASVGELADDAVASTVVDACCHGWVGSGSAATALHEATAQVLRNEKVRSGRVDRWAVLQAIGRL
jgi:tetratricopeptide (TPR) repeat protein